MKTYSIKVIDDGLIKTTFQFFETKTLPKNIPISTPFTFPFIGDQVVLANDIKVGWNPLGGKIEEGETWVDTLKRESYEEAGVYISNVEIIGYILATKEGDLTISKFPAKSIMPVTISFVDKVNNSWKPRDTSERGLFKFKEVLDLLSKRRDGPQMQEIFEYVQNSFILKSYITNFRYQPNKVVSGIPITQVMGICFNALGEVCIVRDHNEKFFSLVGGGCELGESPVETLRREAMEEAQIEVNNIVLLGTVLVDFNEGTKCVSNFQHCRYICKIKKCEDFIPRKNGFETEERRFVKIDELPKLVMLLQNSSGKKIIKQLINLTKVNKD